MNARRASSSRSALVAAGSRPAMACSAPDQKTVPTTAASWSRARRSGVRVSSRAAITAWIESGRTVSAAVSRTVWSSRSSRPWSSSMRQTCSAYSGLPPMRPSRVVWAPSRATARPSRAAIRRVVSASDRGASVTVVARSDGP